MNTTHFPLLLAALCCCFACQKESIDANCDQPIGSEYLTYRYYNDGTPTLTPDPIDVRGNITFDPASARRVANGVEITIPGVRIRTSDSNYAITRLKIDEKQRGDNCFTFQSEFTNDQSSFQTDIASVLVLDMSTSLQGNINELKTYAKDYAGTVVNSSPNATVAVVFFSDRDAIESTRFYTSADIDELNARIDGFTNYQERTALYQAVQEGLQLLEELDFTGEKSIVAFTDGGDNDSNNPSQLVRQITDSPVEKFAIGLRGADFQQTGLRAIVGEPSNLVVADDVAALEDIFRIVGRGVVSVYEIRYTRSDQLLTADEAVEIRISAETDRIR
ncbi:vWA domain-containing protein [Lewinella sp. IMCC34183]|uniref:vWA domain-containing protein n=1 Tax=Lewinella sp. IMCC34183 TaxID=2248762 RepID=UPI000E2393F1|nr:vWA domain-containing protein [Lewinella sp. IMCC34183]